jgi:uncharacterized protein with von Willebrand factor type A (vWA) domain
MTGALAENVVHFTRLLRRAGLRCGPGAALTALRAVEAVGLRRRDDFRDALHAVLVTRREEGDVFRHAFEIFWRDPLGPEAAMAALLPKVPVSGPRPRPEPGQRRLASSGEPAARAAAPARPHSAELDLTMSWSNQEVLRTKDFEQMSAEEQRVAERLIAGLRLRGPPERMRRWRMDAAGDRVDLRRSFRATLRSGHGLIPLQRSTRVQRAPSLVLLLDISGSMDRYARVLLHFSHGLTNSRPRVSTFLFGTRLTNVTRQLRGRDVDVALEMVGRTARDWSGGTRIGASLGEFNRLWSRRVLGRGVVVLLITDGLDREGAAGIEKEAARLQRSCRRLVWLNPLLRYEGFEPRAAGIRALLRHVHDFRPVHNLESLEQLVEALSA